MVRMKETWQIYISLIFFDTCNMALFLADFLRQMYHKMLNHLKYILL